MTGKQREHNTIKAMFGHLEELEEGMDEGDVELLAKLFRSNTFRSLLKVEKSVDDIRNEGPWPLTTKAFMDAKQLYLHLRRKRKQSSLIEALVDCLENPHIQALLAAHDMIACEKLIPKGADLTEDGRSQIKYIKIRKEPGEPLGATIKREEFTGRIVIARILHGGAAQRTGSLQQGDEILEVNGIETNDLSLDGVVSLLSLNPETVEFKIVSAEENDDTQEDKEKVFVRAHFCYSPFEDPLIPCKDAGLAFSRGDILEIMDNSEPKWWQARRHGIKASRSGIIPSKQLQEKRLALKLWSPSHSFNDDLETSTSSLSPRERNMLNTSRPESPVPKGSKRKTKSKKVKYRASQSEKCHTEEIILYEEVTQIMPNLDRPRPVVITGVPTLDCENLKLSLVQTDPDKFQTPVTYTSRSRKSLEQADKDYHFISRHEMEKGIKSNTFINVEMVKNNYFAIDIRSIEEIADSGKTCVIYVHAESLPILCSTDLHPYVVFIKAPDTDKLQMDLNSRQSDSLFGGKLFTEEEICKIEIDSEDIESSYGHYFDLRLTKDDAETTLNQLYHAVHRMETELIWVPIQLQ